MSVEDVGFYSGPGLKLSGHVYHPTVDPDLGLSLVICHGFGGTKEGTPVALAHSLAAEGIRVLTFDYRGFGASEGAAGRIVPSEQVEDAVQALAYLSSRSEVDASRIGIYGNSFGGGIALLAAILSETPRAAIFAVPVVSGQEWLRSLTRAYEYADLLARARAARARKAVTGAIELVERFDIMVPDPLTREKYIAASVQIALESVTHIVEHDPLSQAHRLTIPAAIYGVRDDRLVPVAQTRALYECVGGPKTVKILDSDNHFGFYQEMLEDMVSGTKAWLSQHLGGERQ